MTITKYHNYIKLTDFADELEDFTIESFILTGNINCCKENCTDQVSTFSFDLTAEATWSADLSEAVNKQETLSEIGIQSIFSVNRQAIIVDVDLSPVLGTCGTNNCTLESVGFDPSSMKTAIDQWFLTNLSIVTDVIITFTGGNIMNVEGIPDNYVITDAMYGTVFPYTPIPFGQTLPASNIYYFNTEEEAIYVKPEFFNGATEFVDGIYKFSIKWIKEGGEGYIYEENCAFIDMTTKCRVAGLLDSALKETEDVNLEKMGSTAIMLHYGLVNGSNCACNCDGLCEAFKGLINILDTADPNLINDCGC